MKVIICSHPRSGSHWLARLIDVNFFNGSDYLRHYGGHPFGDTSRANGYLSRGTVLYSYRALRPTMRSLYRVRHRFGLTENDYPKFVNTPLVEMFNRQTSVNVVRDTLAKREYVKYATGLFASARETLPAWLRRHQSSWRTRAGDPRLVLVAYEDLVVDFHATMLRIAAALGSDRTRFVDEPARVGWFAPTDAWEKPAIPGPELTPRGVLNGGCDHMGADASAAVHGDIEK